MNFQCLSLSALAAILAVSTTACAAQMPQNTVPSSSAPTASPILESSKGLAARYEAEIAINGKLVEEATYTKEDEETFEQEEVVIKLRELPSAPSGYVPMRLVCAADEGSAMWYPQDGQGLFQLDSSTLIVNFADNSIEMNGGKLEETAYVSEGVTFLPISLLNTLPGITVSQNTTLASPRYEISTSNGLPLVKLAKQIQKKTGMAGGMRENPEALEELFGLKQEYFSELVGIMPFMIRADTIVIGRPAEGKAAEVQAVLEQRKAETIANFENYLPDPLEMAQNGQIVESKDGKWMMLIISPDNQKAIEMFETGIAALEAGNDVEEALKDFKTADVSTD